MNIKKIKAGADKNYLATKSLWLFIYDALNFKFLKDILIQKVNTLMKTLAYTKVSY